MDRRAREDGNSSGRAGHHAVSRRSPDRRTATGRRTNADSRRHRRPTCRDRRRRALHRPDDSRRARRARRLRPAATHRAGRPDRSRRSRAADSTGHRRQARLRRADATRRRDGRGSRWTRRRRDRRARGRHVTPSLGKDLLGLERLSGEQIKLILDTAEPFKEISERAIKKVPTLRGATIVNLFFEASTRTRVSFEFAEKRLSADTVNVAASGSSVSKGETLVDTARNLEAMRIDMVVIRHGASGAAQFLAERIESNVINAGDGTHEHPTQGLLDMLTLRDHFKRLAGVKVCIVGDVLHSRVARSNIWGLKKMGADVAVCGPRSLLPNAIDELGVTVFSRIDAAIEWADALNVLRLQLERMTAGYIPSLREYNRVFGVSRERLERAPRELVILHPGPMNRGVEIDSDVADGPFSVILNQVTNGVAVRMAVLYLLSGGRPELAEAAKSSGGK